LKGRKRFFFEKKKQKTFIPLGLDFSGESRLRLAKVFCFFFSKKKIFLSLAFLLSHPAAADPRLFIEDNDFLGPGGSDIQSILPLITNPDISVLGFTVVSGDGWCDEETAYLLRFLEVAHRTQIPVYKGAVFPLINSLSRMRAWEAMYGKIPWKGAWNDPNPHPEPGQTFHPDNPWLIPDNPSGNPATKPASGSAVSFLIAQVHRHPHQITILAAGPMTNLALAIRIDPSFAGLAKELIFMGGMIDGNLRQVTDDADDFSDFNILFDPEAAHIVLTAPWAHITSLGNVTNETRMTPALVARMVAVRTPVTAYLAKYASHLPLWDEMAAEVAVDPSLVTQKVDALMDVDLSPGMHYGWMRVWPREIAPHQGERMVTIIQQVDLKRFYDQFIKAAQAPVPVK
jgi:inosine-uridine nucleoside N-ribohydrolase